MSWRVSSVISSLLVARRWVPLAGVLDRAERVDFLWLLRILTLWVLRSNTEDSVQTTNWMVSPRSSSGVRMMRCLFCVIRHRRIDWKMTWSIGGEAGLAASRM